MRKWISFPRLEGQTSRQAHADLPENTFEREFGREGFYGPSTHMHHKHPPTAWTKWEGELRPRAFDLNKLQSTTATPWHAPEIVHNAHMRMRYWHTTGNMDHLVINADGDELIFVHIGSGELFCDFGHMGFSEGDYILLPRGTKWRVECNGDAVFLLIEATNDAFTLPEKGMLGPNAVFDTALFDVPAIDDAYAAQREKPGEWDVVIKRNEHLSRVTYPFNPLDVVGWHGDNLPVKLNWRSIRPVMSHRYHIPPSVHTTFMTERFVVCTFVPRPMESDPGALKVPFYHSNNDYDEVIFYHAGEFFSRDNIHPGMMTLHPCGFAHGPHPKAFEAGKDNARTETNEVAVMIDTRDAIELDEQVHDAEWKGYIDSWKPVKG